MKLRMAKDINKNEIKDLLGDEAQAGENNDAKSISVDNIMNDEILESQSDEVSENESLGESNDVMDDVTSDQDPDDDDNNNNDNDVNNMINDMMDKYKNEVVPGLLEILLIVEPMVRCNTQEKKEVGQLRFVQTKHLETHHNLFTQNNIEGDIYMRLEAAIVMQYIKKYSFSQQFILEQGLQKF